jgi:hypothetical protein
LTQDGRENAEIAHGEAADTSSSQIFHDTPLPQFKSQLVSDEGSDDNNNNNNNNNAREIKELQNKLDNIKKRLAALQDRPAPPAGNKSPTSASNADGDLSHLDYHIASQDEAKVKTPASRGGKRKQQDDNHDEDDMSAGEKKKMKQTSKAPKQSSKQTSKAPKQSPKKTSKAPKQSPKKTSKAPKQSPKKTSKASKQSPKKAFK